VVAGSMAVLIAAAYCSLRRWVVICRRRWLMLS
jgi:hypothetical protein